MSDNVAVTPGIGTEIATDDVGGVQYQKVKIFAGTDGTIVSAIPIEDNGGSITVDGTVGVTGTVTVGAHPVTNAGTFATQENGAALTSLQLIDDAIVIEDAPHVSGDKGVMALVVRKDAATALAGTDGDYSPLQVDASGALRVVGGTSSTQYAEDSGHISGDTGTLTLAVRKDTQATLAGTDLDYAPLQLNATGALRVEIAGDTVGSTTDTDDGTVAAAQASIALVIAQGYEFDGTNWVRPVGEHTTAHDAVDAGNPPKLGAKALAAQSGLTLVSAADRTHVFAGVDGILLTRPHSNLEDVVSGNASNTDGTSTACIGAQASGVKTYLTTIILTNMHASTDAYVEIKDGSTVKLTIPIPHASGAILNLPVPLPGSAATAWNFDPSAAVTTVYCSMVGFKSKV